MKLSCPVLAVALLCMHLACFLQVKVSLGMNIMSSLAAATGTILFVVDENTLFSYFPPSNEVEKVSPR